ncbi:DUF2752 domain-containing protein [Streptacidiphilus melanogenes]|uniref:DUF2752 domain-containing protein n=1 Tax=Streptacidiphilus melanogenes TaxID=411235 RepID=UPI0005A9C6B3|nr:DUF2752 domain-containing protein [Streptacidiphilus melanogenes]
MTAAPGSRDAVSAPGATASARVPLGLLGLGAAATAYVGAVDPNRPGHYLTCPFLALTGWWCPGCGGLRAVHALTRGDLGAALHDNVLVVALCGFTAGFWGLWALRALRGRPRPALRLGRPWLLAAAVLVLAFTLVRNLPTGAFLAP